MNDDMYLALVAYGLHLMQRATGVDLGTPTERVDWDWIGPFEELLGTAWPEPDSDLPLTSIFSRVHLPEQGQEDPRKATTAYLKPAPLEMEGETLFPCPEPPKGLAANKVSKQRIPFGGLKPRG